MKVKVFKFRVSNAASAPFKDDKGKEWYKKCIDALKSPEDIEKELSEFMKGKEIISVLTNTIDVEYHNNGRGNTVDLIYTIMYK